MSHCHPAQKCVQASCGGISVIPALRRLRKEDGKFKASLSYIIIPCLKKK
jgi:hypothetical protein